MLPPRLETEGEVATDPRAKVKKPSLYRVILHNDDYTTMEFVVYVLETVFHKARIDAVRIMLLVHNLGKGTAGTYPFEIAETKAAETMSLAREYEYPLLCTVEEV